MIREVHGGLDERGCLEVLGKMIPVGYRLFAVRGSSGETTPASRRAVATSVLPSAVPRKA